jgi:dihydroorotase
MTDVLIKGGTVIDPAQGIHEILDVAITGGRVEKIAHDLPVAGVTEVIDASNKIVTPGLIDLHSHVYRGDNHRNPDELSGLAAGVTTLVDAGGTAPGDIEKFWDVIVSHAKTTVYSFLGCFNRQAPAWEVLATERIPEVAAANPDVVKGVKIHSMPVVNSIHGLEHLKAAKDAAVKAGLPLMLHIGDIGYRELPQTTIDTTARALEILGRGDIVTHLFSPLTGSATDDNLNVLPALQAARDRGVYMDSAIGDYQFGWRTAEAIVAQGFLPDTIATDIEIHSQMGRSDAPMVANRRITGARVISERTLVEYMAMFFKLGFSLDDIVRMATQTPAQVLNISDSAGSLRPGMPADVSVLKMIQGHFKLTDATGESRIGSQAIVPVVTTKAGVSYPAGAGAHPWGFSPPHATQAEVAVLG